ncbi:hypothetical protein [Corynebacterium caspium]|uniref:hypothetical protein n=1 Tax=Corynebacterium caspium TaxID=234828 RepID=UPI0003694D88|nr:hypothetical protein [Corynebacterium caspium]WKD59084.1 hypothetical protein CCASP_03400 [Corynebacterium caspium DSM 44850]
MLRKLLIATIGTSLVFTGSTVAVAEEAGVNPPVVLTGVAGATLAEKTKASWQPVTTERTFTGMVTVPYTGQPFPIKIEDDGSVTLVDGLVTRGSQIVGEMALDGTLSILIKELYPGPNTITVVLTYPDKSTKNVDVVVTYNPPKPNGHPPGVVPDLDEEEDVIPAPEEKPKPNPIPEGNGAGGDNGNTDQAEKPGTPDAPAPTNWLAIALGVGIPLLILAPVLLLSQANIPGIAQLRAQIESQLKMFK